MVKKVICQTQVGGHQWVYITVILSQGPTDDLLTKWKNLFNCQSGDLDTIVKNSKNVCGPNPIFHNGIGYVEAAAF